jgi:hypothetical protein
MIPIDIIDKVYNATCAVGVISTPTLDDLLNTRSCRSDRLDPGSGSVRDDRQRENRYRRGAGQIRRGMIGNR